jgi:hypothetical protein
MTMKHCKDCKHIKRKGYFLHCKLKTMYVSYNADWCDDYKLPLIKRLWIKIKNTVLSVLGI